mmetsp:Transcript_19728/g.35098  ORF Transcript_19728/g.35098 Transcript_19728/m.35098 type:complete len:105 (-) Transcript_19728:108-422(-)
MPPPKKRITRYWTRRRHLLHYLDHYRFLWKPRHEHLQRHKYQKPLYDPEYTSPVFRHAGFWPDSFGFHRTRELIRADREASGTSSDIAPAAPTPPSARKGDKVE